ncbi:hypothetical protein N431DRAFT_551268 [Stipitochalara longipes BDJ]|nr:hypothetical protein N431DRAFT_551268 [Stipitochalara longipes BDJ]
MQKPSQQSPVKSRQIKLRASCDTCFLAKVKCSKARPVCSRCLACGAECNYSPSCRAGKRKSLLRKADRHITLEGIHVRPNHASKDTIKPNRKGTVWSRETQDTWVVPDPTFGISGGLLEHEISSFVTSIPLYHEVSAETEGSRVNDDFFNPFLGWISPTETDNTSTYFDHVDQSHSYRLSFPSVEKLGSEWATQKRYGPFPSPPPEIVSSPIINSSIGTQKAPACQCFNSCLETLQKLYDRQFGNLGTEPFLTENQDAIATCSKMLGCPTCATKGLSELQATILATIMSNLLSTFQNAWNNCLGTLHRKRGYEVVPGEKYSTEFEEFGGGFLQISTAIRKKRRK